MKKVERTPKDAALDALDELVLELMLDRPWTMEQRRLLSLTIRRINAAAKTAKKK